MMENDKSCKKSDSLSYEFLGKIPPLSINFSHLSFMIDWAKMNYKYFNIFTQFI